MNQATNVNPAAQLEAAKKELTKLPLLGPAMWLMARDQRLRYTFVGDLDWRLLPPLLADQCRLYSRVELPWAFVTWAFVSDEVDQRLRTTAPVIAPHEWKSGANPWLIDVISPFGEAEEVAKEAAAQMNADRSVRVWLPSTSGQPLLKELSPRG